MSNFKEKIRFFFKGKEDPQTMYEEYPWTLWVIILSYVGVNIIAIFHILNLHK
jgi:hypothetical protein